MKTKNKWIDYVVSGKTVASAIFEYLERRKIKVNRKTGIKPNTNISGWRTEDVWVKIQQ